MFSHGHSPARQAVIPADARTHPSSRKPRLGRVHSGPAAAMGLRATGRIYRELRPQVEILSAACLFCVSRISAPLTAPCAMLQRRFCEAETMTDIRQSTALYEDWLRAQLGRDVVETDLVQKHGKMRESPFAFLRATYWRWAETALEICPDAADAPPVLAVGDIHLENFGTWRDADGRLVWGVNDFDEAAEMPYVLDLIRLATSALVAREGLGATPDATSARASCDGYREGLKAPQPVVLDRDRHGCASWWSCPRRGGAKFWKKIEKVKAERAAPRYRKALAAAMPEPRLAMRKTARSVAGAGSLGRPRWIGVADWRGAPVVREAEGAGAIGLGTRARQRRQGQDPLHRDRRRPLSGDRPMAPHQGRHRGAPSLAQQPQDRGGRGSGASVVAGHAARHGTGSRQRTSRHRQTAAGPSSATLTRRKRGWLQDRCNQDGKGRRGRPRCMGGSENLDGRLGADDNRALAKASSLRRWPAAPSWPRSAPCPPRPSRSRRGRRAR